MTFYHIKIEGIPFSHFTDFFYFGSCLFLKGKYERNGFHLLAWKVQTRIKSDFFLLHVFALDSDCRQGRIFLFWSGNTPRWKCASRLWHNFSSSTTLFHSVFHSVSTQNHSLEATLGGKANASHKTLNWIRRQFIVVTPLSAFSLGRYQSLSSTLSDYSFFMNLSDRTRTYCFHFLQAQITLVSHSVCNFALWICGICCYDSKLWNRQQNRFTQRSHHRGLSSNFTEKEVFFSWHASKS